MPARRLTNAKGWPKAYAAAVEFDDHVSKGSDWSVTTLIRPPQMVALERLHADVLVEDVDDRTWLLFGTAVHVVLERAGLGLDDPSIKIEQRYETLIAGKRIAAKPDVFNDKPYVIDDYKLTSTYSIKNGEPKDEWVEQINLTAAVLRREGETVKGGRIFAILRDFSPARAKHNEDLPQQDKVLVDVPMWKHQFADDYLHHRVYLHEQAKVGIVEPCSDEERWAKPATWAVKKPGQRKAVKLCKTLDEAKDLLKEGRGKTIEERKATYPRCEKYCRVAQFCDQWREVKALPKKGRVLRLKAK